MFDFCLYNYRIQGSSLKYIYAWRGKQRHVCAHSGGGCAHRLKIEYINGALKHLYRSDLVQIRFRFGSDYITADDASNK